MRSLVGALNLSPRTAVPLASGLQNEMDDLVMNDLSHTAVHEAGHAVIGRVLF
jgi:hypothetical protein